MRRSSTARVDGVLLLLSLVATLPSCAHKAESNKGASEDSAPVMEKDEAPPTTRTEAPPEAGEGATCIEGPNGTTMRTDPRKNPPKRTGGGH
jgi:hypothetical protein